MTEELIQIMKDGQNKRHQNHVNAGKKLKEKYIQQGKQSQQQIFEKMIDYRILIIKQAINGVDVGRYAKVLMEERIRELEELTIELKRIK